MNPFPMPPIATPQEWLDKRLQLLKKEKALTDEYDRINAERRRLPMVKIEKDYVFDGEGGQSTLRDLFADHVQLIVYHFMFGPDAEAACPGCTSYIDAIGDLSTLGERNTSFVIVSRGPLERLLAYREERGWKLPWYSSGNCDFNFDFGVTLDPHSGPVTYNYKSGAELIAAIGEVKKVSEMPGTSVFIRDGHDIYHTYSTFARGGEDLTDSYRLLDITPYGRQEDFEDSPAGWPQKPTYG